MLILQTQPLSLREFVPEDVNALAAILSDPETMQFYPMSFDHAAVVDWITRNRARYANDGYGLWAMILHSTGELIGDCGLVRQTVDGTDEIENRLPRTPRPVGSRICLRSGSRAA